MTLLRWALVVIAGLGVAYAAVFAFGAWRWSGATRDLVARLDSKRLPSTISRYSTDELAGLPAPVQRYFRAVLTDNQSIVTAATLTQSGTFNMGKTADQWKPFTATQHFTTARAGFVWDANITMAPGVPVRVVDAFIAGEGLAQRS